MATNESTNSTPTPQMSPGELTELARRLRAGAESVVLRDCPHQQADLLAASLVIEQLLKLDADIRAAEAVADRLHSLLKLAGGR